MTNSHEKSEQKFVAVVGPTAVGKTDLVLRIAEQIDAEIVNVDSMQIYRFMDIGTAKPSKEEQLGVRHHLLDIVDPDEEYNVSRYIKDAELACLEIAGRHKLPLLTGGTGLYLKSFQDGVFDLAGSHSGKDDEKSVKIRAELEAELKEKGRAHLFDKLKQDDNVSAKRIHPNDTYRLLRALQIYRQTGIPWSEHLSRQKQESSPGGRRNILKIGLTCSRDQLYERINLRTEKMFEAGLLEEVKGLMEMGFSPKLRPMQSIGYRHAVKFLAGEYDKKEALRIMARDTRHYAKRQYTWFKKDSEINWFKPKDSADVLDLIKAYLD